jgi:23S rRNA pseudouridine1911/1915/1917 synthase
MSKQPGVVFEDGEILVLDKPSGWIVNEANTTGKTPVVQAWLKENIKYPIVADDEFRSGIVHRLDKETSGLLLVAKTKGAFRDLQDQFKKRLIEKEYIALVHGKIEVVKGVVEVPVGRLPWNRERFGVISGGRHAKTSYQVEKYFYDKGGALFSLVRLRPHTGRTHQIRIHLKYLGHPVVSDQFYAGRKTARSDRKWCPRLFLHASKLGFSHPGTSKLIEIQSKTPAELLEVLRLLDEGIE